MSKIFCVCGGIVRDTVYPSPTEGWIIREQDQETFMANISRDVVAFFTAIRNGKRDEWIGTYFSPDYPSRVSDESIVNDILAMHQHVELSIAECEQCGRLWIQRAPGENSYRSYLPDEPGYAALLRRG